MTRHPRHPAGMYPPTFGPLEILLVTGLTALASLGLGVWATGWVLTGGQLQTGLADSATVVTRLLADLGDPAGAWPPADAARLPGPIGFYGTLTALIAVPLAGGTAVATRVLGRRRRDDDARWASRRDLRALRIRGPGEGRVVLGRHAGSRRLLAAEAGRSLIVLGPSRSGKTSGLAIPAILEWDGPVVATSVKTDLVRDTAGWRATRGDVQLYDPTGSTGLTAATWSPLAGCTTWMGAVRTAHAMASTVKATGTAGGLTDGDFWYASAAKLLAPLLFAAATHDRPIADVVTWLNTQEERHVTTLLDTAGVPEASNAFTASTRRADNQKSSIYTTAETVLAAYEDPVVAASAATSTITPERLLEGNHTLYLCAPRDDQRRLRPLFVGLLHQVLTAAGRRAATQPDGKLDRPLLVVLDEAANIAPLPDLDELASTAMGLGITLITVFQDLAQIRARYHTRAATIVNNHAGMLVLRGMRDLDALTTTSELLGRHTDPDRDDRPATGPRPLMAAAALRSLPGGRAVAIYQHLPPFQVDLRPHYTTRHLRDRAALTLTNPDTSLAGVVTDATAASPPEPSPDASRSPSSAASARSFLTMADVVDHAEQLFAIASAYDATDLRVFGSVADGTAVAGSDLNLLVDIGPIRRLLQLRAMGEAMRDVVGVPVEVLCVDMLQNPAAALTAIPLTPVREATP